MEARDPEQPEAGSRPQGPNPGMGWTMLVAWALVGVLIFWTSTHLLAGGPVREISYSEFKQDLAAGKVLNCEITPQEIRGQLRPSEKSESGKTTETGTKAESRKTTETGTKAEPGKTTETGTKAEPGKTTETGTKAEPGKTTETGTKAEPGKTVESGETAETSSKPEPIRFRTVRIDDPGLLAELEAAGIPYRGSQPSAFLQLLPWLIPVLLLGWLWWTMARRAGSMGQAAMSFGRSRARLVAERAVGVRFDDVAGCEEAKTELHEVVDFLREPDRFTALGARIPKGVLLVGPPGTGKTLLARAVAGEAQVPFFSLSGSDFVEMFVGVGAARVRDLFQQAQQHAPCIIFIDELDAIGRARGVHVSNVNDEREHTLNQLLVEMDGFEPNNGVVLLAATNRPDVLDAALLRPGRFDRQVVLDAPDVVGREAILRVHARDKPLAEDVNLAAIARGTPGFAGADLANAVNEAALLAARRRAPRIAQRDLEEAVEKVVAGPERKSRRLGENEKRRVAFHESGHAVVAAHCEHADPVRKVSIVPRGRAALGYTLQLPTGDQYLMSRSELLDRICGLLGGRAAEDLVLGEVSTGAENDLEQATNLARRIVAQYGMGKAVGLTHCVHRGWPDSANGGQVPGQRDCSDATAHGIDEEVRELLDAAYSRAKGILAGHRDELDRVAEALLERESLDEDSFRRLIGAPPAPDDRAAPPTATAPGVS